MSNDDGLREYKLCIMKYFKYYVDDSTQQCITDE